MEYNNIYKILLSLIPIYFYYVPNFLIKKFFLEFIKDTFLTLGLKDSPAKVQKLDLLESRVGRIISFISFLSICVATFLAVVFNKNTCQVSIYNLFHIYLFCVFIVLGSFVSYKNLFSKDKFIVDKGVIIIETFVVFVSVIIAFFIL